MLVVDAARPADGRDEAARQWLTRVRDRQQPAAHLAEGLIVARRHIHMTPADAGEFKLQDKAVARVYLPSAVRSIILENVLIRVGPKYALECHIDTDEANSCDFKNGNSVFIV